MHGFSLLSVLYLLRPPPPVSVTCPYLLGSSLADVSGKSAIPPSPIGSSPLSVVPQHSGNITQCPGGKQKAKSKQVIEENVVTDHLQRGKQGDSKPIGEGGVLQASIRETTTSSQPEGKRKRRGSWGAKKTPDRSFGRGAHRHPVT